MTGSSEPPRPGVQAGGSRGDADPRALAARSLASHCQHLEQLAANLRQLGMDEREIGAHVISIFHEYERELIRYVESTGEPGGRPPPEGMNA